MNEESHVHLHHEPNYFAHIVEATDETHLKEAFRIRKEVFVREQFVDEVLEYDEYESTSKHYLAIYNDEAVGTCRWRFTDKGIKLERFAVIRPYRSKGIGAAMLKHVLEVIPDDVAVHCMRRLLPCRFTATTVL